VAQAESLPQGFLSPVPRDAPWAVGPDGRRVSNWTLLREPMLIGRAEDAYVLIRDPSVSRRHAMLSWSGKNLVLAHISTVNPTLVNGVPVTDERELYSMDRLQFGGVHLEVLLWNAETDAETKPHAPPRALAVILAADVVGYTRAWQRDESGTRKLFARCEKLFREHAQAKRGRVLDTGEKGDCVYSLYHSIVDALDAAVAIQRELAALNEPIAHESRMHFRFGMHSGDVVFEGEGVRGDAINTAAHLQERAEAGELVVSARIRQEAEGVRGYRFEEVRELRPGRTAEVIGYRLVAGDDR